MTIQTGTKKTIVRLYFESLGIHTAYKASVYIFIYRKVTHTHVWPTARPGCPVRVRCSSRHPLDLGQVADAHGAEGAGLTGSGVEVKDQVVVSIGKVGEDTPVAA